jgi:hypothetical protein
VAGGDRSLDIGQHGAQHRGFVGERVICQVRLGQRADQATRGQRAIEHVVVDDRQGLIAAYDAGV